MGIGAHRRLERARASWRSAEHEAEVDVDEMAVAVDEDVAVVPILGSDLGVG